MGLCPYPTKGRWPLETVSFRDFSLQKRGLGPTVQWGPGAKLLAFLASLN